MLKTHSPVCGDCYIVQSFVREHPDLGITEHRERCSQRCEGFSCIPSLTR